MATRDPVEHSLHGRRMALLRWSREDPKAPDAAPALARAGLERRFLDEVDPDRTLPEDERVRRAARARQAYYVELARKSAVARRRRKDGAG